MGPAKRCTNEAVSQFWARRANNQDSRDRPCDLRFVEGCLPLIESFHPRLVRAAVRQFGLLEEESRDLVQEVVSDWLIFAKVRDGDLPYRDAEHLLRVLHRMSSQRWIDRQRRCQATVRVLSQIGQAHRQAEDLIQGIDRQWLVQSVFKRLPEQRRRALRAFYIEGFSQEEVAEVLGIDRRLVSEWKCSFERAIAQRFGGSSK